MVHRIMVQSPNWYNFFWPKRGTILRIGLYFHVTFRLVLCTLFRFADVTEAIVWKRRRGEERRLQGIPFLIPLLWFPNPTRVSLSLSQGVASALLNLLVSRFKTNSSKDSGTMALLVDHLPIIHHQATNCISISARDMGTLKFNFWQPWNKKYGLMGFRWCSCWILLK